MATLNSYVVIVEQVMCELAGAYASRDECRTLVAFDQEHGQYLLIDEGWDDVRRVHQVWAHVEIRDGRIWVHEDGTEEGIASLLLKRGVPNEDIVLGFYPPSHRLSTDFAAA